mmetsp:Transcript_13382/g.31511  ORF Transcript_13382/g.31511 Transcript_13382/m.31511 type:complete len:575 (+) Transcript_13382:842-2566(+)
MSPKPKEYRIFEAALFYNMLKLQPTVSTISIPRAMICCKSFTHDESRNRTLQKRVEREAARKETREAARVKICAAAQATLHAATNATNVMTVTPPPAKAPKKRMKACKRKGFKKFRLTAKQKQQQMTNDFLEQKKIDEVFIKAVQAVGLGKPGPRPAPFLSEATFKLLVNAFESYMRLNQVNQEGRKNQRKLLERNVKQLLLPVVPTVRGPRMVDQLMKHSSIRFDCKIADTMEERRSRWTTHRHISAWFDQWEVDLVELGFGSHDETGKLVIPLLQLRRIINIDETALSFDSSEGRCGGRPAVEMFDPSLQASFKRTSKSSVTITMITGSSAAGEAIAPHFQFPTRATSKETKFDIETARWMKQIRGHFGINKNWECTYGKNEKGGMNVEEFEKYVHKNIIRLFPDAADVSGSRVILKCDGGPGRDNQTLLAALRVKGIYLYPCVPNTTAVTQETDQSFGLFKTVFRQNLNQITDDRLELNKNASYTPRLIGLLVFGGEDPVTKIGGYKDAFAVGFSKDRNLAAWASVGAAPLTRRCLESEMVAHTEGDPMYIVYKNIEAANHSACNRRDSMQ